MTAKDELSAVEQAGAALASAGMTQPQIAEATGRSLRTVERWHAKPAFKAAVSARIEKVVAPTTALLDAQAMMVNEGAPQAAKVLLAVAKQTEPIWPVTDIDTDVTVAAGLKSHEVAGDNCVLEDGHLGWCERYTANAMKAAELIAKGTGLFRSEKANDEGRAAAAVIVITPAELTAARERYIDVKQVPNEA